MPHPARRLILYLVDTVEKFQRKPTIAKSPIESLDISGLLRLPALNVFNLYSVFVCLGLHSTTDIFWFVIAPNNPKFPSPADDLLQRPNKSLSRQ